MSWNDVKVKDINPGFDLIPKGRYTFQVVSAKANNFDDQKIDMRVMIVSEGEAQGRQKFVSYPNPDVQGWSPKALKRLEEAVGIPIDETEDSDGVGGKIAYLNRLGQLGARFSAEISHRTYKAKETGEDVTKDDLKLFTVGAAA